jgi:hypothetical protein
MGTRGTTALAVLLLSCLPAVALAPRRSGTACIPDGWSPPAVPDGIDPYDPAHDGAGWDRAFTGTVTFVVR